MAIQDWLSSQKRSYQTHNKASPAQIPEIQEDKDVYRIGLTVAWYGQEGQKITCTTMA